MKRFTQITRIPLLALGLVTTSAIAVPKPNILFIMADNLGKDWIECYGADEIETPHLNQLARTGMKFHNAWSMPQCTPSRMTLLTGQYPWRTGWVGHWDVPRWGVSYFDWKHYTTFANVMKTAGYTTAIAGKWQLNDFRLEPNVLRKHGFDDWCMWTGNEKQNPLSSKVYWDPYLHTKSGSRTHRGKYGPDVHCDFLIEFMHRNRDEPMMLYFPMVLAHSPTAPTPLEPNVQSKRDQMKAMVRYTDHLIGRLLKTIGELGLRKRTIIIFTTDNGTDNDLLGTVRGQRPRGGNTYSFEGGVCAPFIVNCPGLVPEGVETEALTDFSDLLPTFAELGHATLPNGVTLDGKSFAPLILGKSNDSPRAWIMAIGRGVSELDARGVRGIHDYNERVIRDKRFKAWVSPQRKIAQLFDLQNDPLEKINLMKNTRPEVKSALRKFQAVVDTTPVEDAKLKYDPRPRRPWERELPTKKKADG